MLESSSCRRAATAWPLGSPYPRARWRLRFARIADPSGSPPGNRQAEEPARQQRVDLAADICRHLAGPCLAGRELAVDREEIGPEDQVIGGDLPSAVEVGSGKIVEHL